MPGRELLGERNHALALLSAAFLCGCVCAPWLRPGLWLWAVCGLAGLLMVFLRRLGMRMGLALALCCFAMGALRAHGALVAPQPEPGNYEISGFVYGGATLKADKRIAFTLDGVALNGAPAPGRAYCTLRYEEAPPELFDGARVRFEGRVYLPEGKSGPPHMDFSLWMRQNGMRFGVAAYRELTVLNAPGSAPVCDAAYRVREAFRAALERVMGEEARVAMALLLGQREGLSEEELQAFRTLGVAHVMSVSGLHVGLLGGALLWLLERLRLRRGLRLCALSLFLAGYCWLTGLSPASIRAAVMLVMAFGARMLKRRPDRLTTLAAAMLAVLLLNPLDATSAGFVLSFSAMLGILALMPALSGLLERLWPGLSHTGPAAPLWRRGLARFQRGLKSLLAVSIAAQAGVLLPTAAYFYQLPLYGIFINLLIVPLAGALLTPLYAVTLILSPVPLAGMGLGAIAGALTRLLLWLVGLLSALPHAAVRVPAPPLLLSLGIGGSALLLCRVTPGSLKRRACAAALALAVAAAGTWAARPARLRYIQLSVGQADSALLMDGSLTLLIDAGDDGQAALDYLLDEGRDVDALFITHLHMDHIGGVEALLNNGIRIHQAYLPVNAGEQRVDPNALALLSRLREAGVPVAFLARGDRLRYNETAVEALWPVRETVREGQDANDLPLVLSIDFGGYIILSASDLTGAYEVYAAAPADVLKVAHHGSSYSTGNAFLSQVSPAFALVSCSSGSRSLPGEDTLKRLAQSGARVLRTDLDGDITLTLQNGALCVTPYKAR